MNELEKKPINFLTNLFLKKLKITLFDSILKATRVCNSSHSLVNLFQMQIRLLLYPLHIHIVGILLSWQIAQETNCLCNMKTCKQKGF